jgi:SRSO17 transposase
VPLARIDLAEGQSTDYRRTIGEVVYDALVEILKVPNTTPLRFYEPPGGFVRMNSMNKTYTPELAPEVLQRLRDYAEQFRDLYRYPTQFSWSGVYLRGLLQDGDRKSIEPMAARVPRPAELLDIRDPEQALQQFVNQSPWDEPTVEKRYRSVMAGPLASPRGIFVIDDTGFPKQGKHSVGVQRQYCGQLGKKANCQVAVTVHYVSPKGHFPAALRLYLPESWTRSPERLEAVGVPER